MATNSQVIGEPPAPIVETFARGAITPMRNAGVVAAIFTGNGAQALIYDALPPVLHQVAAHFGGGRGGELMAQMVSTIPILGGMLSGLFTGIVVEKLGVRASMLLGLAVFAIAGSAGFLLDHGEQLLASRFVLGMGVGLLTTSSSSLLAMRFEGAGRARMNGVLVGVGALIGFGWLIASGYSAAAFGWRAPFLLHPLWAGLMLIPILMVGVFRTPPTEARTPLSALLRLRPVLPVYAMASGSFIVASMFGVQLSFVLASMGVTSPALQSNSMSLTPIGVAVASLGFSWLEPRFGWKRLLPTSYLLLVGALLLVALTPDPRWIAIATSADGLALGLMLPCLWMLAMQRAPHDLMPRALGLMTTAIFLGGVCNPVVLAPIRAIVGIRGQYVVVASVVIAGLALAAILNLRTRRVTAP